MKSGYKSSWRERWSSLFFFSTLVIFFNPSLALIIEKNCTAFLHFILTVFTVATTISHTQTYPKFIFLISRRQPFSTIQKKGQKPKRKSGHKLAKNPITMAPILPTTHLFRIQISTKTVTKNTLKLSLMKQCLPWKSASFSVYTFPINLLLFFFTFVKKRLYISVMLSLKANNPRIGKPDKNILNNIKILLNLFFLFLFLSHFFFFPHTSSLSWINLFRRKNSLTSGAALQKEEGCRAIIICASDKSVLCFSPLFVAL